RVSDIRMARRLVSRPAPGRRSHRLARRVLPVPTAVVWPVRDARVPELSTTGGMGLAQGEGGVHPCPPRIRQDARPARGCSGKGRQALLACPLHCALELPVLDDSVQAEPWRGGVFARAFLVAENHIPGLLDLVPKAIRAGACPRKEEQLLLLEIDLLGD